MVKNILDRLSQFWWWAKDAIAGKPLLGGLRSPDWSTWRKTHIKKKCECCGKNGTLLNPLELHHVLPFHLFPAREKDPENVITLCRPCHFENGHLMSFRSHNKDIKNDAAKMLEKIVNRP